MRLPPALRLAGELLASRRGVGWAVLLAAGAAGLAFVPQLDLLNYFFSTAAAFLVGLAGLHMGLSAGRRLSGEGPWPPAPRLVGATVLASLALALVPLLVITLNALRVRNCDYVGGLAFYAMGPLLGAAYAAVAGIVAGAIARQNWPGRLVFAGWIGLALAVPLWRFYTEPPVHLYHPVLGYFSGAIYDEVIEIGAPFIVYRFVCMLELATVALLLRLCRDPRDGCGWGWPWRRGGPRAGQAWLAVGLAAILAANLFPATLGFRFDRAAIRVALGGHLRTAHFDLYYPGGTPYEGVVGRVAGEHERCYAGIVAILGRAPEGRIQAYIYPDAATKRRLMGADRVYIAKPWLREIHLNRVDESASVIRHELVHAIGSACAPGLLGVPARAGVVPHMGLIEGLAVAIEWPGGRLTVHQAAAAMRRLGMSPDIRRLLGPEGFWTTAARKAYLTAGSFVRHLMDRRGTAPLCRLYVDADFAATYGGEDVEALFADWEAILDDPVRVPLDEEELRLARDVFDRPSVFRKVCALEVARYERAAERAALRRRFREAAAIRETVAGFDGANPEKRFLWGRSLLQAGALAEARDAFRAAVDDAGATRVLRLRARAGLADVLWREGHAQEAAAAYRALLDEPMEVSERRTLRAKASLAEAPPPLASALSRYLLEPLLPGLADRLLYDACAAHPEHALLRYLLGRRRLSQGRPAEAIRELEAARAAPRPLAGDFAREADRLLGIAYFGEGELAAAAVAFRRALARARFEGERVTLRVWLDRVAWWRDHPGGLPRPWRVRRELRDLERSR